MSVKHIMIPYFPKPIFFKAFENGLNIAKQNNAKITIVKTIDYPMGLGLDEITMMDLIVREHNLHEFDKILPNLQEQAAKSGIILEFVVYDWNLSPAKVIVDFTKENDVDLMILSSVNKSGLNGFLSSNISEEIMDLNPSCSVIVVE